MISSKGIHYLDFSYNPQHLNELFATQLSDLEIKKLADKLIKKSKNQESVFTKLQRIQQYIHDHTYHLAHIDRIKLYPYIDLREILYPQIMVDDVFSSVIKYCNSRQDKTIMKKHWLEDKKQKRCEGCLCEPFTKRIKQSDEFRGLPPLICAEEATLAGALSILTANINTDSVIFFGSPVHVCTYVRPTQNLKHGCVFDSKMLYLPKDLLNLGKTPKDRKKNYMKSHFGDLWFIVHQKGFVDIKHQSKPTEAEKEIINELDRFFGINN